MVVAAGNDHTSAPTFPAAFTHLSDNVPAIPLVSVGALNPDGLPAGYSNHGPWVLHQEIGTAVLSTVPIAFDELATLVDGGKFDPQHTHGGLARWGGTSFAAATLAGKFAAELTTERRRPLADVSVEAVRACRAVLAASWGWTRRHDPGPGKHSRSHRAARCMPGEGPSRAGRRARPRRP